MVAVVRAQVPGGAGADEEADPEGDPDHRERPGPLLGRGHVGDVGLRDGEISGREPVDDPGEENEKEVGRERKHEEAGEGADLADGQDGLPADVVRDLSEDGSGHELADRVGADEQAHHRWAGAEVLRVERQERQQDGEAEDVDQHHQEDGQERRPHRSAASLLHASSSTASSLAKQKRSSRSPSAPR